MHHNINAGRLRDLITVSEKTKERNNNGERESAKKELFQARADCNVRSSSESTKFGYLSSDTIVTMLMWYTDVLTTKHVITWKDNDYEIVGVPVPDDLNKSMIVTCKRVD